MLAVAGSNLPLNRVPDVDSISRGDGKTGSHRTKKSGKSASARNPHPVRRLVKVGKARDELVIMPLMRPRSEALSPFKTA